MSRAYQDWAFNQELPMAQKIVLMSLAHRHNAETGRCDPSMDCIASDCGMSKDTAKRAVRELEAKGMLAVRHRQSGPISLPNQYEFPAAAAAIAGGGTIALVGAHSAGGRCTVHPGVGAQCTPNRELQQGIKQLPLSPPRGAQAEPVEIPATLAALREQLALPSESFPEMAAAESPADVPDATAVEAKAVWLQVQRVLVPKLGRERVRTWLAPLQAVAVHSGELVLRLPDSQPFADVGMRFGASVRSALRELALGVDQVDFVAAVPRVEERVLQVQGLQPNCRRERRDRHAWRSGVAARTA